MPPADAAPLTANELIDAARPFARRLARIMGRKIGADPEELLQEFLLSIWRNAHRYDPARGGVFKFTFLRCRKVAASRKWKRWAKSPATFDTAFLDQKATSTDDPARLAELADDADKLRAAVANLPDDKRFLIEARFGINGHPVEPFDNVYRTLGLSRTTGLDLQRQALRLLAVAMGADPDRVTVNSKAARSMARRDAGLLPPPNPAIQARRNRVRELSELNWPVARIAAELGVAKHIVVQDRVHIRGKAVRHPVPA